MGDLGMHWPDFGRELLPEFRVGIWVRDAQLLADLVCQSGVWRGLSRGISISGTSTGWTTFPASVVQANTLLASNPPNSQITIPFSGNYFITSAQYTCTPGTTYAGTTIYINGVSVAAGVSYPNSCDSGTASVFKILAVGDIVTATCGDNGGRSTTCYLTILKV